MQSKLIVLPTEMTIKRSGLAKGNGKRVCEYSDSDEVSGTGITGSKPRGDDTESEAYPESDVEEDAAVESAKKHQNGPERKKIRSEGSSSSEVTAASRGGSAPSQATFTSRASGSTSAKIATITVTTTARKPSAWEIHRRKEEARRVGR